MNQWTLTKSWIYLTWRVLNYPICRFFQKKNHIRHRVLEISLFIHINLRSINRGSWGHIKAKRPILGDKNYTLDFWRASEVSYNYCRIKSVVTFPQEHFTDFSSLWIEYHAFSGECFKEVLESLRIDIRYSLHVIHPDKDKLNPIMLQPTEGWVADKASSMRRSRGGGHLW